LISLLRCCHAIHVFFFCHYAALMPLPRYRHFFADLRAADAACHAFAAADAARIIVIFRPCRLFY